MFDKINHIYEDLRPSPELVDKINERWGVVYHGTENEHAADLAEHGNDLFSQVSEIAQLPVAEKQVDVPHLGGQAIGFETRREQTAMTEQEQLIMVARRARDGAYNDEIAA